MLLDHGHPDAWRYTIGAVHCEARLVAERLDAEMANLVGLQQMMISTIPNQSVKESGTRRAAKEFTKRMKDLLRL